MLGGKKQQENLGAAEESGFEIASPMALAVTNKRLLSLKISNPVGLGIGGDVKELVSAAPLGEVDSIELKRLAVGKTVTVTVRGTPFVLEVGAGANAKGVVRVVRAGEGAGGPGLGARCAPFSAATASRVLITRPNSGSRFAAVTRASSSALIVPPSWDGSANV